MDEKIYRCETCTNVLMLGCYCHRCDKPTVGRSYFPYLVNTPGLDRTDKNTLECYLGANPQQSPVYISAVFDPTQSNKYIADVDFKRMVKRVSDAPEGERRFATVFQRGRPCYLHIDVDDTRPDRPNIRHVVQAVKKLVNWVGQSRMGVTFNQWNDCFSFSTVKGSAHLHAYSVPFEHVGHAREFMRQFCIATEAIYDDENHQLFQWAQLVCDKKDGVFTHVVDTSIYSNNHLLKLPYQAKRGKSPMIPDGSNLPSIYIASGMAHTPALDGLQSHELFRLNIPSTGAPKTKAPDGLSATFESNPELVAHVRAEIKKNSGGSPAMTITTTSQTATQTVLYIKYSGVHECCLGVLHKTNNARVIVNGTKVVYRCFECPSRFVLADYRPDVPMDEELVMEEEAPEEVYLDIEEANKTGKLAYAEFEMNEGPLDEYRPEMIKNLAKLHADYMAIVEPHWVKIAEKKIIFGEKRRRVTKIKGYPSLTDEERTAVQAEWITREKAQFIQSVEDIQVVWPTIGKKSIKTKVIPLVELWIKWPGKRRFNHLVNNPNPEEVTDGEFNQWSPFAIDEARALKFVRSRGWSDEECIRQLKPWLDHCKDILADGSDTNFDYQQNWFTWVLQKKRKAGVALLVMSDHGAGKSCVADYFATILGPLHACTLTKGTQLTGDFNSHLGFKTLVISEEATYGGDKSSQGYLKNLITADQIMMRPLYHPMIAVDSRHNIFVISNMNRHTVPIEPTERRYACFNANNKFAGVQTQEAETYFTAFRQTPPHLVAWYYYHYRKLGNFNPRKDIPITNATSDQKIRSLDTFGRFVMNTLQTQPQTNWEHGWAPMTRAEWHTNYLEWCNVNTVRNFDRLSLNDVATMLDKYLKSTILKQRINGFYQKRRKIFALHKDIEVQKQSFAKALGLARFPELGEDGNQDAKHYKPFTNVFEPQKCGWSFCNSNHRPYIRKNKQGCWVACNRGDPGATDWHHADPRARDSFDD